MNHLQPTRQPRTHIGRRDPEIDACWPVMCKAPGSAVAAPGDGQSNQIAANLGPTLIFLDAGLAAIGAPP